jgi:hydroxyethylthiazole kinase
MKLYDTLNKNYNLLQQQKPIILNLTNSVTQDFMANALLALGASPIMSNDSDELEELIAIASAININIGTLDANFAQLALKAVKLAKLKKIPIILDPVGAGATKSRTNLATLLAADANIIRGNASEIMAIAGNLSATAGVDSVHSSENAKAFAQNLAHKFNNTVVVTGKTDLIIDTHTITANNFGAEIMTKITGMGCSLTAVVAAFAAINSNYTQAALVALTLYTMCAQNVALQIKTPAKFKVEFIDNLYAPNWHFIQNNLIEC